MKTWTTPLLRKIIITLLLVNTVMFSTAYLDNTQTTSDLPEITTIVPNTATLSGGTEVVITGKNFDSDSVVILGDGVALDTVVESANQIRFRVPEQVIPGIRTLTVETSSGVIQKEFFIKSKPLAGLKDGEITTIVGGAVYAGDGANALDKSVSFFPSQLITDSKGNVFFSDVLHNRIRRLDAQTAVITTVVGNGRRGLSGDGDHALTASLDSPSGIVFDLQGNLFIADRFNHRIRRVDAKTKIITTIAGTGPIGISKGGFSGDNGPAINAQLDSPSDLAVDKIGNIYIADSSTRIRRIDASTGIITSIAGTGRVDFNGDNIPATSANVFVGALVLDDNKIYFTDVLRVRQVDLATGIITTVAGNGTNGFTGDRVLATNSAVRPLDITLDKMGNIFICDANTRIRKVDAQTGIITTIAGNGTSNFNGEGGPAINASLLDTRAIAIDKENNIFIKDSNLIRRISSVGIINRIAGQLDFPPFFSIGDFRGDGGFRGDDSLATEANLNFPKAVALDNNQSIFIADTLNNRVRKVDVQTGVITTIVGDGFGGFNGDGGLSTKANINFALQVAIDRSNNLFIADTGNSRIRSVNTQTGIITTVAGNGERGFNGDGLARDASLNFPNAIVIDKLGNLLVADTSNHRVRQVNVQTGIITTIAGNALNGFTGDGGLAREARLDSPSDIALDADGNIFISDGNHNRIRRVDIQTGIITTIAGSGGPTEAFIGAYSGDNGLAINAKLNIPSGLMIDANDNLLFVDSANHAIRLIKGIGRRTTSPLPPAISPINNQALKAGATLEVPVIATDPNGQSLVFSLALAPNFTSITNNRNGMATIKFVPSSAEVQQINRVVVVVTNSLGLSAQTSFNLTVTPNIIISDATYSKPNLTITGLNFGTNAQVFINGKDISKFITSGSDTSLILKGSDGKLGLKSGVNQIVVSVDGVSSNTFVLSLFATEVD